MKILIWWSKNKEKKLPSKIANWEHLQLLLMNKRKTIYLESDLITEYDYYITNVILLFT